MQTSLPLFSLVTIIALTLAGCGHDSGTPGGSSSDAGGSAAGAAYQLPSEPAGAQDVKAARTNTQADEEVVVVGRIGGDQKPWVDGIAAFRIADLSMKPCAADEGCPTPWDYCCNSDLLPSTTALVKIVDGQGRVVASDSRQLLGVKELQTVVVRGKALRDEAGNLTILANGIFVRS
ncbi:MAG: hypothetical protein ACYC6N_05895 [Pirellulaceae bacterium]